MRSGRPNAVETAASAQHDRADDLLGAVVPLRMRERLPATSEKNDLSNVIPFHPRHHRAAENDNAEKPAPAVVCNHNTRPCPFLSAFDWRKQWPLLLVGSVAAHAGLFTWLMQEPPPKASIGLEVIAVEMVVGAQSEAGTAKTPGQTSVENGYRPDLGPPDAAQTELTEKPVLEAKDEPKEIADKPKPVAQEEPKPQFMAAAPPEPRPEPELAVDPEPKKEAVVEAVKEAEQPVAKKPVKETGKAKKQRIAARSDPTNAANSIGRGRSDADHNYRGAVIAHLSRHKQFPAEARDRGEGGTASVSFTITGSGAVTSVRLARSSGSSSLDREVQAMVRRASPFPPPPSGQSMSFTAPINFSLR
jgi:periplasmic protein TonB